jgi:hypothetical protein
MSHNANSGGKSLAEPQGEPLSTRMILGRPRLIKTCLRCVCTNVGGTQLKCPSGKNDRLQDGSRTLVVDPQPGDHGSVGQAFLLGRIDLPDFMNHRRTGTTRACGSSGGSRWIAESAQPALQGAFAGKVAFGKDPFQLHEDTPGPPTRMLIAQL